MISQNSFLGGGGSQNFLGKNFPNSLVDIAQGHESVHVWGSKPCHVVIVHSCLYHNYPKIQQIRVPVRYSPPSRTLTPAQTLVNAMVCHVREIFTNKRRDLHVMVTSGLPHNIVDESYHENSVIKHTNCRKFHVFGDSVLFSLIFLSPSPP